VSGIAPDRFFQWREHQPAAFQSGPAHPGRDNPINFQPNQDRVVLSKTIFPALKTLGEQA